MCVVGLGLIGGSLLRSLAAAGVPVFGADGSAATCAAARSSGFVVYDAVAEALRLAEARGALVCVAVPMGAVDSVFGLIAREAPSVGVFDVVSVKEPVLRLARDWGLSARYVGTHPMAGTAESGWSAGDAGLFSGATWVMGFDQVVGGAGDRAAGGELSDAGVSGDADAEWASLWASVARLVALTGARVVPSRARVHDEAVARVSHLPHVLAEALAVCGSSGGALARALAAGSFRDGTRVAGTRPELVRAMCETNASALLPALDQAIMLLEETRAALAGDFTDGGEPDMAALAETGFAARAQVFPAPEERGAEDSASPAAKKRGHGSATHAGAEQQNAAAAGPGLVISPGEAGWVEDLLRAEAEGLPVRLAGVANPPRG